MVLDALVGALGVLVDLVLGVATVAVAEDVLAALGDAVGGVNGLLVIGAGDLRVPG